MSIRPWMPLYVADYLADTAHLNAAESGAYLHLIMHYWLNDGLPTEDRLLARICKLSLKQWKTVRPVIERFFLDDWRHKRIEHELAQTERLSIAGRAGGLASAAARKKSKTLDNSKPTPNDRSNGVETNVQPLHSHTQLQLESKKDSGAVESTRPDIGKAFDEFWKSYPKRDGANPKEPARKVFTSAIKSGADPESITDSARRYAAAEAKRGHVGTPYIAQAVTWLRQSRWSDYTDSSDAAAGPIFPPPPGQKSTDEILRELGHIK